MSLYNPGNMNDRARLVSLPTPIGGRETRTMHAADYAAKIGIRIPTDLRWAFEWCESGAEVRFLWELAKRGDAVQCGRGLESSGLRVMLQATAGTYRIDFLVTRPGDDAFRLAVEVDGMRWHHHNDLQVEADYLRSRRLTLAGYSVIRFTAREVFTDAGECWRQVDSIMDRRAPIAPEVPTHG